MKSPVIKIKTSLPLCTLLSLTALVFTANVASANTERWIGVSGTSATTNWSDNLNWNNVTGGGTPGPAGNDVIFGDGDTIGQGVVNSVVDANLLNPNSLTFTNNSANGNFYTVLIPDGIAVTNANAFNVGIRAGTVTGYITTVGFVGGGTVVQNGTMQVENSSTVGGGFLPWLDMSGLTNFIMTNATATLSVAGLTNNNAPRGSGRLDLAQTNTITANAINVALGTGNGGIGGTINLGGGSNTLNVGSINMAGGKINTATIKFLGATGGLRIRGTTGADSDRNLGFFFGNRTTSGSGQAKGALDTTGGHPVDIKASVATLGRSSSTDQGMGSIAFDAGTVDITTINMGITTSTGGATGSITNSGGFLIVSNMSLANQTGTTIAGTGNLVINAPGTVIVSNNIVKTTTVGVGNITMTGGTLIIGTNIGAAGNAIDTLSMSDATVTLPAQLTASAYITGLTGGGTANTINVSSLPNFFSYPAQFQLISYVNALGDNNTFVVGSLPGGFIGYISNNVSSSTIDIVITNGPAFAPPKSIRWNGSPTGDWTTSAGTLNWLTNSTAVNFNQGDAVTFDDTLTGTTNVNLAVASLLPGSVTVNNSASNYQFTGIGKISGVTGLTKTGAGTLIIDNSANNDFAGAVTISAGTLQVGNNDTNGNLPAVGPWDDEGTLAFSRSDNLTISTVITGAGSLVQNGNGKLSLGAANTYSGNTIVTKGTLAMTAVGSIDGTAGIFPQGGAFDVTLADPSKTYNVVGATGGTLVVGTNTAVINSLGLTNSTITLSADFNASQSITVNNSLTTDGSTNIINITAVRNVPDGQGLPIVIPIIRYAVATFTGGFKIGETNFPNAYVTNNAANSTIDLVLTASPYLVTWNGGSAVNNNWSDSNNWSGIALVPGDGMTFDGTTRLTPFNDTTANTIYSNITFNGSAGAFTLTGNPIVYGGTIANNSGVTQTMLLAIGFTNNVTINGGAAGVIIGGGLTNVSGATGTRTLTLMGSGILTNLFGSATTVGGTNGLIQNDAGGTWTLLDNATATPVTAPWAFELNAGTFNFGSASSAPVVNSTSGQGVPSDNQLGNNATAVFNFTNGTFTTTARFNTGGGSGSGTINQYGGTINIGSQFQGANGSATATSAVNLYGGTMNIANGAGQFYVASRGNSSLTITNSALLNCGILDVSRSINGNISGTVNLDGGTITATRVGTATANSVGTVTGSTATFNFNGGTLKAHTNSTTFFQGSVVAPIVPITAIVTARGANIDSDTFTISFIEPLLTDPNLGGAADGGLKKFGTGTLNVNGTNTYIGQTLVGAGTLNINGQSISAVIVSNNATLGGNGVISNTVTVNAGGALSPGNNAIGTLTVATNAITLNGTTKMEVDKVQNTSDLLALVNDTPTTITYGGTLNVVTTAGTIALSDSFKLFSANNYTGAFSAINPATPGSGLAWNTNNLTVDGTLSVVAGAAGPTTNATITKVTLSGTNLLVHGTNNNVPNNTLHYVVLTATNLSTALSNWTPVVTNTYNADGTFDFSSPIVPGIPQKFIGVQAAP